MSYEITNAVRAKILTFHEGYFGQHAAIAIDKFEDAIR